MVAIIKYVQVMFKLVMLLYLVFKPEMLLSGKRQTTPTLNSTVSDNHKDDSPTDYCSSLYSNNYQNLIQSQQINHVHKVGKINKRETKMLLDRLSSLRMIQSTMNQKFEMCIKKLEHELESKQAQNEFVRDEIQEIKKDMKETKADILLIKEYLFKQEPKKVRGRRAINLDEIREIKGSKGHRFFKI